MSTVADRPVDPDRLAALEDQRRFLLRSLDDLKREREAGDVSDDDYRTLRDDYTARAATVLRAIEAQKAAADTARRPLLTPRNGLITLGVVAFAVVAGLLVASTAGTRTSGDTITGDVRASSRQQLAECLELAQPQSGELLEAVQCYEGVLEDDPGNPEALTYLGWVLVLTQNDELVEEGAGFVAQAIASDPTYPDARAFSAIIANAQGRPEDAIADLDALDELNPPADIADLLAQFQVRERAEAQLEGGEPAGGSPGADLDDATVPGADDADDQVGADQDDAGQSEGGSE
ncbi:MAG: tetratricopeptide repeat protein [Actinomycetota bacterium]|nr:tetratricopeptide repeat protein [Actinomycetota bacterium]